MIRRFLAVAPVLLAGSLFIGMSPASAVVAYRAHWALDETGSSPTAFDSSGNGNHGTNYNVVGDGSSYGFDGQDSRVVVPSSPSLNPGTADFSFGVTLSTTLPQPLGETYDVLRKGLSTSKTGFYKIEIHNVKGKALARCVSKTIRSNGTKATAAVQGTTNLADGQQHVVSCAKTSTGITLSVDSLAPRTTTIAGGLGSVSNDAALALGAKAEPTAKTGFDWFQGRIHDAWVS